MNLIKVCINIIRIDISEKSFWDLGGTCWSLTSFFIVDLQQISLK